MDAILDEIDRALKKKRLSDAAASQLAVGHPALIKKMRMPAKGEKRYNYVALQKLAEVLDLELYFGPPRDVGQVNTVAPDVDEYVKVPLHAAELAAGAGATGNGNGDDVSGELVFSRAWMRKAGLAPSKAALAHVRGDSMEPTLRDGDVVLLDTSKTSVPARPRVPGRPLRADLYAFREGDELRIKRIEHSAVGQLILHSDNTSLYAPELHIMGGIDDFRIIGKVVWSGHKFD